MSDYYDEQLLEAGDPWLYQMQMLEYEASQSAGKLGSCQREISNAMVFSTIVVGTKYYEEATYKTLQAGDNLILVLEPENQLDSNAVAVFSVGAIRLGYLPREDAAFVAARMHDLNLKQILATYRRGRVYISGLELGVQSLDLKATPSTKRLVDIDDLGDFNIS
jgi:hypothetical protein